MEVINSKGSQLLSHNTMIILDTIWTKGSSFHLTKAICQKLEAKTKMTSGSGYHVLFGPAKQFLRKLKFLRFQFRFVILYFLYIFSNVAIIEITIKRNINNYNILVLRIY